MAESPQKKQDADLRERGLTGISYDSLMNVVSRTRAIGDWQMPFRRGLTMAQITVCSIAVVTMLIIYVLILSPIFMWADIHTGLLGFLLIVFGPAVFLGWRITLPMPYRMSIAGWIMMHVRSFMDTEIHRRGVPVESTDRPDDLPVERYQREWVRFEEYVPLYPAEQEIRDKFVERNNQVAAWVDAARNRDRVTDLQSWVDSRRIQHLQEEAEQKTKTKREEVVVHDLRGRRSGKKDKIR